MDIDQRLDKLAERHEALTQSVELLVHTQREGFLKQEEAMSKNQVLLSHVLESIDSLARIAHAHEQRITGLEDQRQ